MDSKHLRLVGQGEMPAELRRVNWGAVLFTLFWAILWGAWPLMWTYLAVWFLAAAAHTALIWYAPFEIYAVTSEYLVPITVCFASGVIGVIANGWLWRRWHSRLTDDPEARLPIPLAKLLSSNTRWGVAALALIPAVWALSIAFTPVFELIDHDTRLLHSDYVVAGLLTLVLVGDLALRTHRRFTT